MEIKIIIPSDPIVKKNSAKMSFFDSKGKPRKFPLHYYSKAYNEWGKIAVQACAIWKTKNSGLSFPLKEQWNLRCLFYMSDFRRVDLSALYEGIQDVLAGNAGVVSVPSHIYQIIEDDSTRYIASHDGSRLLLDKVNPRMEVYLTPFIL